jgi:glycosyltransferase involved in cell wall biosynthesis
MESNNQPSGNTLKLVILNHRFPTQRDPSAQTFIKDHVDMMLRETAMDVSLVVPRVYSIPGSRRWRRDHSPLQTTVSSTRPYYLSIPKMGLPAQNGEAFGKAALAAVKTIGGPADTIIHAHMMYPAGFGLHVLANHGYKTVLSIHGSDWFHAERYPVLTANACTSAEIILTSSESLAREVKDWAETHRLGSLNVLPVMNAIDTELFKPEELNNKAKSRLGLHPKEPHVLFVGRPHPVKGLDILLEALAMWPKDEVPFPHIHLVGVGDESKTHHDLWRQAQQFLPPERCAKIHMEPPVTREDLVSAYQAADLYVLPSRSEGFNVSLLEAAACQCTIVATDVGGNRTIAGQQGNLCVEPENAPALLEAIITALQSSESHKSTMRNKIIDQYSFAAMAKRLISVYESL